METNRALLFSVVLALLAALLHFSWLYSRGQSWKSRFEPLPVVVAKVDIPEGKQLDASLLDLAEVPKDFVQPKALTKIANAEGLISKSPILKGEQVLDTKLARPGETWVSLNIPEDKRACSIPVNDVSGVSGLIRPGNRVDVIGIFRIADPKTKRAADVKATTLLQNEVVLSIGRDYALMSPMQKPSESGRSGSTVTLALTQKQCQDLALAQQVGSLSLALRSFFDRGKAEAELRSYFSTTYSVTGLKEPLDLGLEPKWMELRGERTMNAF